MNEPTDAVYEAMSELGVALMLKDCIVDDATRQHVEKAHAILVDLYRSPYTAEMARSA